MQESKPVYQASLTCSLNWIDTTWSKLVILNLHFWHHHWEVRGYNRKWVVFLHCFILLHPAHITEQCFWIQWSMLCFLGAVKCSGPWHCQRLTSDPGNLCSVLPLGLMDEAESIDAPSPAALIRLLLFLSMLLFGPHWLTTVQCL